MAAAEATSRAPAPAAAEVLFGTRLAKVQTYAELLAGAAMERGLIGPGEASRLWDRHILNCAVLGELLPPHATVIDIGSGAGLPGIVLALTREDISVVLVEPQLRRATFLEECRRTLELDHVVVRRARAEELAGVLQADVVTARAVAPIDRLARWALPLLAPGGRLLAVKGVTAPGELAGARSSLRAAGAADSRIVQCGVGVVEPLTTVIEVSRGHQAKRRRD